MRIALGIVALVFGSANVAAQLISTVDFRLAQRLGLQERREETEPLYSHLELNTARWDLAVLWTLVLAGILMLMDHAWWPWTALIAGGIYVDTGGREMAKLAGLAAEGIKVGSPTERQFGLAFLALLGAVGLALIVYPLTVVA